MQVYHCPTFTPGKTHYFIILARINFIYFILDIYPAILTAAEPDGVCEIARTMAEEFTIPLKVFYKQAHRASGQYHWRSVMAIKDADFILFQYS